MLKNRPLCLAALFAGCGLLLYLMLNVSWTGRTEVSGEDKTPVRLLCTVDSRVRSGEEWVYECTPEDGTPRFLLYTKERFAVGNVLEIRGEKHAFSAATNPGQFDMQAYYRAKGLFFAVYDPHIELTDGQVRQVREWLACLRQWIGDSLRTLMGEEAGATAAAILLGDKGGLEPETKRLYQAAGLSHMMATSGLHISITGMALYRLLRKRRSVPAWIPAAASAVVVILYCIMTGSAVSAVRAVVMYLAFLGGERTGRTYDMASALALAALVVMATQPLAFTQAGTWLSFAAILGFVLFPGWGVAGMTLVQLPVLLWSFYVWSPGSILLNLLAVPALPVLAALSFSGVFAGWVLPAAGWLISRPAVWGLWILEQAAALCVKIPGYMYNPGKPYVWQMAVYIGCIPLLAWLWNTKRKKLRTALLAACMAAVLLVPWRFLLTLPGQESGVSLTMLDVGQGDGLVLELPGRHCVVIDGGSTSRERIGQYVLEPYLLSRGLHNIDAVCISHWDEDHISGIVQLLQEPYYISIGCLVLPACARPDDAYRELADTAREAGVPVVTVAAGETVRAGQWSLRCFHPRKEGQYDSANGYSQVLTFQWEDSALVLTGDVGTEEEKEFLPLLDAWRKTLPEGTDVILKVAHHGSKNSTSKEFLETLRPRLALISCGQNNRYGHPAPELLERLEEAGCPCRITASSGCIRVPL